MMHAFGISQLQQSQSRYDSMIRGDCVLRVLNINLNHLESIPHVTRHGTSYLLSAHTVTWSFPLCTLNDIIEHCEVSASLPIQPDETAGQPRLVAFTVVYASLLRKPAVSMFLVLEDPIAKLLSCHGSHTSGPFSITCWNMCEIA